MEEAGAGVGAEVAAEAVKHCTENHLISLKDLIMILTSLTRVAKTRMKTWRAHVVL